MSGLGAKDDWVLRVLGLGVRRGASASSASVADVQRIWNAAKETVDAKLNELAKELRSFRDPQLDRIAERGLFGVTQGGETVSMVKAVQIYSQVGPQQRERATTALRMAIAKYRSGLSHPKVKMVDNNPLNVDVALAATMEGALQEIEKVIG